MPLPKAPAGDSAELKLRGYWFESADISVIRKSAKTIGVTHAVNPPLTAVRYRATDH